jgi:hypothetical protein
VKKKESEPSQSLDNFLGLTAQSYDTPKTIIHPCLTLSTDQFMIPELETGAWHMPAFVHLHLFLHLFKHQQQLF